MVREDKHRENYLGNSVAAPRGRWAQGRDILWYSKNSKDNADNYDKEAREKELAELKSAEREAMDQMLGRKPQNHDAAQTGANAEPLDASKQRYPTTSQTAQGERRHRHRHRRHHRHDSYHGRRSARDLSPLRQETRYDHYNWNGHRQHHEEAPR